MSPENREFRVGGVANLELLGRLGWPGVPNSIEDAMFFQPASEMQAEVIRTT